MSALEDSADQMADEQKSGSSAAHAAGAAEYGASAVEAPPQPLLLDALPYVDEQDAATQEQVRQLMEEEMAAITRTPEQYLQEYLQTRGYKEEHLKFVCAPPHLHSCSNVQHHSRSSPHCSSLQCCASV